MNYTSMQELPIEELEEMLAILKGMQKHIKEIRVLGYRATTMCPTMLNQSGYSDLKYLVSYRVLPDYTSEEQLKTYIEQVQARIKQAKETAL